MALVKIRDEQGEVGHCSVLAQLPLVSIPHANESDRAEETQGKERHLSQSVEGKGKMYHPKLISLQLTTWILSSSLGKDMGTHQLCLRPPLLLAMTPNVMSLSHIAMHRSIGVRGKVFLKDAHPQAPLHSCLFCDH